MGEQSRGAHTWGPTLRMVYRGSLMDSARMPLSNSDSLPFK